MPADLSIIVNSRFTIDPCFTFNSSTVMNSGFTIDPSIIADQSGIVNHSFTAHPSITGNLRSAVKRSTTVDPSIAKNFSFEINVGSEGNIGGVGHPTPAVEVLVGWHRAIPVLKVVGSGHFLSQLLVQVWFIRASFIYGLRLSRC